MTLKKFIIACCMLLTSSLYAQDKIPITEGDYSNEEVEMADQLRASGKIYVVVAVIVVIFVGIVFYLILTDRKIAKLEKELGIID